MSTPRIFQPQLIRWIASRPAGDVTPPVRICRASFQSSARRRRPEAASQRYGTANEPPPHIVSSKADGKDSNKEKEQKPQQQTQQPQPTQQPTSQTQAPQQQKTQQQAQIQSQQAQIQSQQQQASSRPSLSRPGPRRAGSKAPAIQQEADIKTQQEAAQQPTHERLGQQYEQPSQPSGVDTLKDLASVPTPTVLNSTTNTQLPSAVLTSATLDSPQPHAPRTALSTMLNTSDPNQKPPHIEPPPYVHHFDTYTLVRSLQQNGFTEDEAITMMKAIRAMLADNIALARDGLVSRGDAEMESYLFRAACSELRTEIRNTRQASTEARRSERTQLQHEVDILAQRLGSELAQLKDALKGMFDDRKMAVRNERRDVENAIQELNYKITTRLGSEMKSDVEALRWVLVRRIAIAIVTVAAMVLVSLRAGSYSSAQEQARADAASNNWIYGIGDPPAAGGGTASAGDGANASVSSTDGSGLVTLG